MNDTKKVFLFLAGLLALVAFVICSFLGLSRIKQSPAQAVVSGNKSYSFADFGLPNVAASDCEVLKNQGSTYPISISFTVKDVSGASGKIKDLAAKYSAEVTADSYNTYPSSENYPDSASVSFVFKSGPDKFLQELNPLIRSLGGQANSFSLQGNSQYASSPYVTCNSNFQTVLVDKTQLEILTSALEQEKNPKSISVISQAVSNVKTTLQNDINNFIDSSKTASQPAVNINIGGVTRVPSR